MRRANLRNSIIGGLGSLIVLGMVVAFDLGCLGPASNDDPPVATVSLSPGTSTVVVGGTSQLTATTRDAQGRTVTGRFVTWFSSDDHIATISENGLVTGVAPGTVTISGICEHQTGTATVTVSPVPVASVTVTPSNGNVQRNYDLQLTAEAKDAAGRVLLGRTITWSSTANASVSTTGLVHGETEGQATVTASSEGKSGTALLTVTPNPVVSVTVAPASLTLQVNESQNLTATIKDASGNALTGRSISWVSSNPSVVDGNSFSGNSITVKGLAQGGPVTYTATVEGKSGSAQVTVAPPPGAATLSGKVINYVTGAGIAGASVSVLASSQTFTATTAADGSFTASGVPVSPGGAWVSASASGFVSGEIFIPTLLSNQTTYTEPVPLVPNAFRPGMISGVVRNARTGAGIAGATVTVLHSQTQTTQTTTDGTGAYTTASIAAGTYQVSASAPGYQTTTRTGVVVGNDTPTSGQDVVLSPTGSNDIRIVLTWGATPSDLDSHLTGPNADATRFHVYYASRGSTSAAPFAALDVDDVSAFGPETITIAQMNLGNFRYSVHDFSNRNSSTSTQLGASGAKVQVYTSAGLVQTFFVPTTSGTLWTVFEMTGTLTNPVFNVRNDMSFTDTPSGILSPPLGWTASTDAALILQAMRLFPKTRY